MKALLAGGANPNLAKTEGGTTPCFAAARNGHLRVVEALFAGGADLNLAKAECGTTPCFAAAQERDLLMLEWLLDHGADGNKPDKRGMYPLYHAAARGRWRVVKLLLERGVAVDGAGTADPKAKPKGLGRLRPGKEPLNGQTPLWLASHLGHRRVVELLVKAGADVNRARPRDAVTPLYCAAAQNHPEVARILLQHGAKPDLARSTTGQTPMAAAAELGHRRIVDLLLDAGADVNKKRDRGDTLFTCRYFEMWSPFGASPLRIAEREGSNPEVYALLQNPGTGAR